MTPSYEKNGVEADERAVNGAHEVWRKSDDGRDPKPVSLYLSFHATAKKR